MRLAFGFFIIALTMSLATPSLAYKEVPVSNGGMIAGKVVMTGKEPRPWIFRLSPTITQNFADAFQPAPAGAY